MDDRSEHDHLPPLRQLVDNLPSMLAWWGRDLRCRFANRAYERWFGVDPDGLVGTPIQVLLGPELFALNEPYIRDALRGQAQTFERVVPGPDGAQRHSLAHYVPHWVDGQVTGFSALVTEVDLLKQTETALQAEVAERQRMLDLLRERESALKEAQRLGQIGSWEWQIAADVSSWSQDLYRIHGCDPSCPPPGYAQLQALYRPDSWARLRAAVDHCIRTAEPYLLELEYQRPDGGTGWLEARGEAVRDADGQIVKLRGTAQEVTQRRELYRARFQRELADAANREKTRFLSRVSHELRTPLNAVVGFAHLMQADVRLDDKHRRWARTILDAGRQLNQLAEELLTLTNAELGRLALAEGRQDLRQLVRDSARRCAAAAAAQQVVVLDQLDEAMPLFVRADGPQLTQVLDALLSNAVKYNRPGGQVRLAATLGRDIELSITDTGPGLAADAVARLGNLFERLGAELSGVEGSGLGLALAQRLLAHMGGALRIHSEPGVGSRFTVVLPADVA